MKENTWQERWLIWSIEHDAWWMPNSRGYTKSRKGAGRYTFEEAIEIVEGANFYVVDGRPNEAMIFEPVLTTSKKSKIQIKRNVKE